MIRRRRLEITVEASRRLVVHRQDGIFEARCRECAGQVVFPDEAIVLAGISSREIHRLVERDGFTSPRLVKVFCLFVLTRYSEGIGYDKEEGHQKSTHSPAFCLVCDCMVWIAPQSAESDRARGVGCTDDLHR